MNNYLKLNLIVLALMLCQAAFGQTSCQISSDVFYINGVNKPSKKEVEDSALSLKESINSFLKQNSGVKSVSILYNDSDGVFFDIFSELSSQKALEKKTNESDEFISTTLTAVGLLDSLQQAEKEVIQARYGKLLIESLTPATNELLAKFKDTIISSSLSQGTQAVLVSHSQGNMFANEVFNQIKLSQPASVSRGLAVVNVANPAAKAPSGLYLTSTKDWIINVLSRFQAAVMFALAPMTSNFDASLASLEKDKTGHGFNEVYLAQDLPEGTTPDKSIASVLIGLIDKALFKTSTFFESPNYVLDVAGNKVPKTTHGPADSILVQVCFPSPVGGL